MSPFGGRKRGRVNWTKHTYLYDTLGQNIEQLRAYFSLSMGEWSSAYSRRGYTYNSDGKINSLITYDNTNGQWQQLYLDEYFYDSAGQLVESIYYMGYNPSQKTLYAYDVNGNLIQETYEWWYDDYDLWTPITNKRVDYTYDADQKVTQIFYLQPDWILGPGTVVRDYIYDQNDRLIQIFSTYNNPTPESYFKNIEYTYDAFDNIVRDTSSYWEPTYTNDFEYDEANEYIYNNDINFDDLALPYEFSELYYKHKRVGKNTTKFGDRLERSTYYYSDGSCTIVSTNNIQDNELSVSPNPTSDFIVFDIDDPAYTRVEFYDTQGRLISNQQLPADKKLHVGHFPKGIYFYHLYKGEINHSGKIIIK